MITPDEEVLELDWDDLITMPGLPPPALLDWDDDDEPTHASLPRAPGER